jgi:uncharacterized membrane protein SpoIIM required for sporulation
LPPVRGTDINQFLQRRQESWTRLETLLQRVEEGSLERLSPAEVREFGILYRRASSDLMTARSKTANAEILEYLNDLVARAYAQVYRSSRFRMRDLWTFIVTDFPRLLRFSWKYLALSTLICTLAFGWGWFLSRRDPTGAYYMLPPDLVRSIPTMRAQWKDRTGHSAAELPPTVMPALSGFLMTHNTAIGFAAFAGGLLMALPTLFVTVQTGAMLGILGEAMSRPATAEVFWSLILPHGVVEIPAILVMAASGFIIAGALLAPGKRSRRDALVERGRVAVLLAMGGALMLVLAGLIEGFLTPPEFIPPWAKLLFALAMFCAEVAYLALAGRGPEPGLLREILAHGEERKELPAL